jgi:hypothetical protein
MDYKLKYIKYKQKYLKLQKLTGGTMNIFFRNRIDKTITQIQCNATDTLNMIITQNDILNKPNIKFYKDKSSIEMNVDKKLEDYNIQNDNIIYFTFDKKIDIECPNRNLIKYFDTFTHEEDTIYIIILYSAIINILSIGKNIEQQIPLELIKKANREDKHIHIILLDTEFLNEPSVRQINTILDSTCISQYISYDLLVNINNYNINLPIRCILPDYTEYLLANDISINGITKPHNITKQFKITTIGYKIENIKTSEVGFDFFYFCKRYLSTFIHNKKKSSIFFIKSFGKDLLIELNDIDELPLPDILLRLLKDQDSVCKRLYEDMDSSIRQHKSLVGQPNTSQGQPEIHIRRLELLSRHVWATPYQQEAFARHLAASARQRLILSRELESHVMTQFETQSESRKILFLEDYIQSQLETQTKTQTKPQLETQTKPQLETQTKPQLETQTKPQLKSQLEADSGAAVKIQNRD